jgi:aspartate aminotransferase
MSSLADRLALIAPSPTLVLDAKTKALRASGVDIVNFGTGEPDFDTPEHIREAGVKAIRDGFTRYTPSDGLMELKEAVARKLKLDNGLDYKTDQIVISSGGKHTLYNIFLALFQPGDEVVVPIPSWVSYPPMLSLCGAKPVLAPTRAENGYTLTAEELTRAITPRTRGLIINSPSNPTGTAYGPEQLEELADLALKHDLWIISDDIYEKITFDDFKFHNLPMLRPEMAERTVIAHGLSKTYAMTGWRVGFLAGPEKVARGAAKIQSQTTSNPCSISQKAGVAALNGPQDEVERMRLSFSRRRDLVLGLLAGIPGLSCPRPQGAFYVFPDCSVYLGKKYGGRVLADSEALAGYLLEEAGVAIVPGASFGSGQNLRISYAVSESDIERGLGRVKEALLKLG